MLGKVVVTYKSDALPAASMQDVSGLGFGRIRVYRVCHKTSWPEWALLV